MYTIFSSYVEKEKIVVGVQLTASNFDEVCAWVGGDPHKAKRPWEARSLTYPTNWGLVRAYMGDYIIKTSDNVFHTFLEAEFKARFIEIRLAQPGGRSADDREVTCQSNSGRIN